MKPPDLKPGPERPPASRTVDIRETRRVNLRQLITAKADGSVVRFAEHVGLDSHSVISQIVGPRASRNLGHNLARRIESALQLERGWMDKEHAQGSQVAQTAVVSQGHRPQLSRRALELAQQFDRMPVTMQKKVANIVESIADLTGVPRKGRKKGGAS